MSSPDWLHLGDHVSAARARQRTSPGSPLSTTFVDLGPLSCWEEEPAEFANDSETMTNKEKAVRRSLALASEPDLWSECDYEFMQRVSHLSFF